VCSAAQTGKRMKLIIVRKARPDATTTSDQRGFFYGKIRLDTPRMATSSYLQDCQQCNTK
jgi:hypothetical protein